MDGWTAKSSALDMVSGAFDFLIRYKKETANAQDEDQIKRQEAL